MRANGTAYAVAMDEPSLPLVEMRGPVLVFGGCYSNLEATTALCAEASRLGIPPERIVCTGDVVAYCADAAATVALIRDTCMHVVMGNCEESLGSGRQNCGCGFAQATICDRLSAAWYAHAAAQLTEGDREWMRALPRRIDILIGGRRIGVIHGAVDGINRFVFASTPWLEKARQIELAGCHGVIGGHCGLPFTQTATGKLWHNVGAIGLPANDGTPRVWYSLLSPSENGVDVCLVPLEYDVQSAARKIRQFGLPEGYAVALETGLWPSCDVLPNQELSLRGEPIPAYHVLWNGENGPYSSETRALARSRAKFSDPEITATGERRAGVQLKKLETVWFNTGTLCNLTCDNCYIESSPRNERLVYLTLVEVRRFLDEAKARHPCPYEIGFTGGEPFMNPEILGMLDASLDAGFRVLVLTNAMRPMQRLKTPLQELNSRFPGKLTLRISLDHYEPVGHERLRGMRTWQPTIDGMKWLAHNGFDISVAGRTIWSETEASMRNGYRALFAELGLEIDAYNRSRLVLFPEMRADEDVPEITEKCWDILDRSPGSVMCASSRMVIKRKGALQPMVVACTLLPYDSTFELGATLADAAKPVKLNHRYCARFCVLGGASCSAHS